MSGIFKLFLYLIFCINPNFDIPNTKYKSRYSLPGKNINCIFIFCELYLSGAQSVYEGWWMLTWAKSTKVGCLQICFDWGVQQHFNFQKTRTTFSGSFEKGGKPSMCAAWLGLDWRESPHFTSHPLPGLVSCLLPGLWFGLRRIVIWVLNCVCGTNTNTRKRSSPHEARTTDRNQTHGKLLLQNIVGNDVNMNMKPGSLHNLFVKLAVWWLTRCQEIERERENNLHRSYEQHCTDWVLQMSETSLI